MFHIKSFGVIGGDLRQLYCARSIADDGYRVTLCGFEQCTDRMGLENEPLKEVLSKADAIILPLPCSRDGETVNAPFARKELALTGEELEALQDKPVFAGMKNRLSFAPGRVYDYGEREEFAVENAVPTAEGAIEIAMHESAGTIHGAACLVIGYGRIGRVLADMLAGLGARVTVSARSLRDLAFIHARGYEAIPSGELTGRYELVFNTVPVLLLDACTLARIAAGAVVIDLASMPGGVDDEAARRLSIRTIHALSLPGKVAPKSSGMIMKNAVYHIIREEGL